MIGRPRFAPLGVTWLCALNFVLLQWLFLRLAYIQEVETGRVLGWTVLTRRVPLTGWWSPYRVWP